MTPTHAVTNRCEKVPAGFRGFRSTPIEIVDGLPDLIQGSAILGHAVGNRGLGHADVAGRTVITLETAQKGAVS